MGYAMFYRGEITPFDIWPDKVTFPLGSYVKIVDMPMNKGDWLLIVDRQPDGSNWMWLPVEEVPKEILLLALLI